MNGVKKKKWFCAAWLTPTAIVIIACCLLLACPVQATAWLEKQKLTAPDGAAGDIFGCSVSISGDYVIIGAYHDDDMGNQSGSTYIFRWDGANWIQQAKLTASDGTADDYFGWSVSIGGDKTIVGAYGNKSAYIFKRNDETWSQQAKLTASGGTAYERFGYSVSISGDFAIVGAYDDYMGTDPGSAYIFKWDGANWVQQAKLTAADGAAGDYFGESVSISGDFAIVGAPCDYDGGYETGSAYIFKQDNTVWSQQQKLTATDGAAYDRFGFSVSISGDYVIIGAYQDNDNGGDSGSAYIFRRGGISWVQQQKLTASDGADNDYFGNSVSISGDFAIVGAIGGGNDRGSAYVFKRNGETWSQQQKLLASDGTAWDSFGYFVSISGDKTIIGSAFDDDKGNDSGSAYIFERVCPTADLNGDCCVDFIDFAILASYWLQYD